MKKKEIGEFFLASVAAVLLGLVLGTVGADVLHLLDTLPGRPL